MGLSDDRNYARYHEVLNRAVLSPRKADRILLMPPAMRLPPIFRWHFTCGNHFLKVTVLLRQCAIDDFRYQSLHQSVEHIYAEPD